MQMEPSQSSRQLFFVLMVLAVLARLTVWMVGLRILPPSSDESLAMLMARDILGGHFHLLFWAQPYLFPLESYLAAPLAWLPPGALACRLLPLCLGLLTTALALRLVITDGSRPARWLGGGLAVLPSFYLLILQGFYAPPGYAVLMVMCVLLPLLALRAMETEQARWGFWTGLAAALAFAAHSISLCASLPALLILATPTGRTRTLRRLLATGAGLGLGALPYLVARVTIAGAHGTATTTRPLQEIFSHWWSPTLTYTLPGTMGFRAVPFPDTDASSFLLPLLHGKLWAGGLLCFLLGMLIWRLVRHTRAVIKRQMPRWQAIDLLLATILLNITLFAAAPRADSSSFRYLVPAALSIPLLLAIALHQAPAGLRHLAYAGGIILLSTQVPAGLAVTRAWRTPGFAEDMGIPDLKPALRTLDALNLQQVVASYGAAYRLHYESGGSIQAAQPMNERFPGWPLPYKEEVDAAPKVAYVLTDAIRFLKPGIFERHLRTMQVTASVVTAGGFRIYYDFKTPTALPSSRLDPALLSATVSVGDPTVLLHDDQLTPPWRTRRPQQVGDWIELTWSNECPLNRLVLRYAIHHDAATAMQLAVRHGGVWQQLPGPVSGQPDKFEMRNEHPIYGHSVRQIDLGGPYADGVRLEITEPRDGRDWTLAEIEVYKQVPLAADLDAGSSVP